MQTKKEVKMIKRIASVIVSMLISFAFFSILSRSGDTRIWKNQFEKRRQENVQQDRQMGEKHRKSKEGEKKFTFEIDENLKSSTIKLLGLDCGPARPVGSAVRLSDGKKDEFVLNEVIFRPKNRVDLGSFLRKYGGTVIRDGKPMIIPSQEVRQLPSTSFKRRLHSHRDTSGLSSGWYLIRVDLSRSSLDDIGAHMEKLGQRGHYIFSSEEAARLAALLAREASRGVLPNSVMQGNMVKEHPDGSGGNLDAENWWWMTEQDSPCTPGTIDSGGISVGVIYAWRYLRYKELPPFEGVWDPPIVAIVDGGFALDETTGIPLDDNLDYNNSLNPPLQIDIVDHDFTAGGINPMQCGGSPCDWHGQSAFGVAAAYPANLFGSAGTGGNIVRPMLVKVSDVYTTADGIRSAAINGADIISVSLSWKCGFWEWACSIPPDDIYAHMQSAVDFANAYGAVVIGCAAKEGGDISDSDIIPCMLNGVICVGSINCNKDNVYNFGSVVDIWAPTNIITTPNPNSSGDITGFSGTSASAPFVAGIVGLMKALNSSLYWSEVQTILQNTANMSPDPKVDPGYVDAFRAVEMVMPNEPPTVSITSPSDGAILSWRGKTFTANASDPEVPNLALEYQFPVEVSFSSDRDGLLCTDNNMPFNCWSNYLRLGTHTIYATATDAFGATATDSISVSVVNHSPTAQIVQPANGSTFFNHQTISFGAVIQDQDELPFPNDRVTWSSSLAGSLGTGWSISTMLSVGLHTVTVTAEDIYGAIGQDIITVNVVSGEGVPTAEILSPPDGFRVLPGTLVTLEGQATDPEDGTLSGSSLTWYSDYDGLLGTGNSIQVILSEPETGGSEYRNHKIILNATDSNGNTITKTIDVFVGIIL